MFERDKGVIKMTKKDYIKIASLIKIHNKSNTMAFIPQTFLDGLCEILKSDNPNFDKNRFIAACK